MNGIILSAILSAALLLVGQQTGAQLAKNELPFTEAGLNAALSGYELNYPLYLVDEPNPGGWGFYLRAPDSEKELPAAWFNCYNDGQAAHDYVRVQIFLDRARPEDTKALFAVACKLYSDGLNAPWLYGELMGELEKQPQGITSIPVAKQQGDVYILLLCELEASGQNGESPRAYTFWIGSRELYETAMKPMLDRYRQQCSS